MRKLDGLRIVVTRAAHQAEELARPLRERGAEVLLLPAIAIAPPADPHALEQAAAHADQFDWIVFTSANAIRAFVSALGGAPGELHARVATVGSGTRAAAESAGLTVSLTPEKYIAEVLVESFGEEKLTGQRILIPSAAVTRDVVAPGITGARGDCGCSGGLSQRDPGRRRGGRLGSVSGALPRLGYVCEFVSRGESGAAGGRPQTSQSEDREHWAGDFSGRARARLRGCRGSEAAECRGTGREYRLRAWTLLFENGVPQAFRQLGRRLRRIAGKRLADRDNNCAGTKPLALARFDFAQAA